MTDIVERLRTGRSDDSHFIWTVTPTHIEAADEITRLRELLSEAEKREKEARAKALDDLSGWIEEQRKDVPAHGWEFAAAIRERALQSEER